LIMLDRLRQRSVDYAADVATVDSHAESDRGHHYVDLLGGEPILRTAALPGFHPGVVVSGPDAICRQILGHRLGLFSADAVDDRGFPRMTAQSRCHLRLHV